MIPKNGLRYWDSSTRTSAKDNSRRKLSDYTIGIVGSIQPGIIDVLSSKDNQFNGFYHRFLFVFPESEPKPNFEPIVLPRLY